MLRSLPRALAAPARRLHTTPSRSLADHYSKAEEHAPDVVTRHDGRKVYVASQPDEAHKPYEVPSGAFHGHGTDMHPETPTPKQSQPSSSSVSPVHPTTTQQAKDGELADRNPPPIEKKGEDIGKKGLGAWSERK